MSITINGSGSITGISSGGLPSGTVTPASLSTGAPSWDSSGNLSTNSGYGSNAVEYGCRAWVNFNGTTASPSTIRGSGNVSSVTKNGTGDYTVNFTTAMPDANYTVCGTGSNLSGYSDQATIISIRNSGGTPTLYTASACRMAAASYAGSIYDTTYMNLSIFR